MATTTNRLGAGQLRHRVVLQSLSAQRDSYNEIDDRDENNWTDDSELWAKVSPVTASEREVASSINPKWTHNIVARHAESIHARKRFLVARGTTTLAAAISSTGDTGLTLASADFLEANRTYRALIGSEKVWFKTGTTVSTSIVNVHRGAYGTTAATHASGATVQFYRPMNIASVAEDDDSGQEFMVCMCESGELN